MPVFRNESELVEWLKNFLERCGHKDILTGKNLRGGKFQRFFIECAREEIPLAQPEIDLIFRKLTEHPESRKPEHHPAAVEVKYIRYRRREGKKTKWLNWSYYKGIEQALAYLKFGFYDVELWHVFDYEVEKEKRERYIEHTKDLIDHLFGGRIDTIKKIKGLRDGGVINSDQFGRIYEVFKEIPLGLPIVYGYGVVDEDTKKQGILDFSTVNIGTSAGLSRDYIKNPYFNDVRAGCIKEFILNEMPKRTNK